MAKDDEELVTHIMDLPAVVLSSVLARLGDPVDIMSTLSTCRLFWVLVRTAPFRLRLRPRDFADTPASCRDAPPNSYAFFGKVRASTWTGAALRSIQTRMSATRELDLSGCFVTDDDVAAILTVMRSLERLVLDNCPKLTSSVADVLAASVKSGPSSVSLQRCFGLGSSSTGNLLIASAANSSKMRSILLSHLSSLDISHVQQNRGCGSEMEFIRSEYDLPKSVGGISIGTGLRILALNNCAALRSAELISVAMMCPFLEVLLLGGSLQVLGLSRIEGVFQDTISSTASTLVRIIEQLPRLQVLELTFFAAAVIQAVRERGRDEIQIWDFCEESSVTGAACVLDGLKKVKLGSFVKDLRNIASPVHQLNNSSRQGTTPVLFSKKIRAQFWQDRSSLSDCISTGSYAFRNFIHVGQLATLLNFAQSEDQWGSLGEDVAFGLRGAVNCSDVRNRTPLHMAASRGDVLMIAGLLSLGAAAVGVKDSSGGTALFVAAESGYAQACELLLQSGADVLASNRAGETPLYIAALRGHSAVVSIMLAHCYEHGVNWQDADVYGMPLLPHIVPSFGGRNFARTSFKSYAGTGLSCQSLQTRPGSNCFSRLWELPKDALHENQVENKLPV